MDNTKAEIKKIQRFSDLVAWQEGHKLVLMVYREIRKFPPEERYGLSDQMKRAAVSITSNIAEGFSRKSAKEKYQFYSNAKGSMTELQNQLLIARDVGYIPRKIFNDVAAQSVMSSKLLTGLLKSTRLKRYDPEF